MNNKTMNNNLVFQSNAPVWFKTPIPGPAPGPHMRRPGCNGAVCYCNDQARLKTVMKIASESDL